MISTDISGISRFVIVAALLLLPSAAAAHVDCDRDRTGDASGSPGALQRAILKARPGDTIVVSGTCHENVIVPVGKDSITLDGRGTAAIVGSDLTKPTIFVRARDVTIQGFTITGGLQGIHVEGGSGRIDGNTIRAAALYGVEVGVLGTAHIVNNTIQNNGQAGIAVAGNSNAFIGFGDFTDSVARPNLITENGTQGIVVFRNSWARIVGNDLSRNTANGVVVREGSQAQVSDNMVNGNGANGIMVLQGSGVLLGGGGGNPIFLRPNTTTINNGAFGIRCQLGGFTDGLLGSLNGANGAENYSEGCVPSLIP